MFVAPVAAGSDEDLPRSQMQLKISLIELFYSFLCCALSTAVRPSFLGLVSGSGDGSLFGEKTVPLQRLYLGSV
jgi:hypothetical protein